MVTIKKAVVVTFISNKTDVKVKMAQNDKEDHYTINYKGVNLARK